MVEGESFRSYRKANEPTVPCDPLSSSARSHIPLSQNNALVGELAEPLIQRGQGRQVSGQATVGPLSVSGETFLRNDWIFFLRETRVYLADEIASMKHAQRLLILGQYNPAHVHSPICQHMAHIRPSCVWLFLLASWLWEHTRHMV